MNVLRLIGEWRDVKVWEVCASKYVWPGLSARQSLLIHTFCVHILWEVGDISAWNPEISPYNVIPSVTKIYLNLEGHVQYPTDYYYEE